MNGSDEVVKAYLAFNLMCYQLTFSNPAVASLCFCSNPKSGFSIIRSLPTIRQLLPKLSALSPSCESLLRARGRGGERGTFPLNVW